MKENIVKIILNGVAIINCNLEKKLPVNLAEKCPIYGTAEGVDSISLVSLISIVEDSLERELGISIIIANEKAMSRKNSPFLNVGILAEFICDLISSEKQ
jgi:hypothetical protein